MEKQMSDLSPPPYFHPRGHINWVGLWTLYSKEVRRFLKVGLQTVAAPAITTLIFMVVFVFSLGTWRPEVVGIPFSEFLAPGLIMMALIQNAFANTSSSLLIAKLQGNIVDYLMIPLSTAEFTFAMCMSGVTRGLVVAVAVGGCMGVFVSLEVVHWWAVVYFSVGASLLLSLLGLLVGIWSHKFDHLQAITSFIIIPLSMLSGTFYSISTMPEALYVVSKYNPFFYMIDGFRYGFLDHAETNIFVGVALIAAFNVLLWSLCYRLLHTGWRMRA